jgi:hypothetical protein
MKTTSKRPARMTRATAGLYYGLRWLPLVAGDRRGRHRRLRERDEHLDGATRVIEADLVACPRVGGV